ncbi:MAG: hypothetical protein EPN85_08445 [Bacteroidetes bacterium]|nr:MAG: hypothetical protein EPN85_08445 [Bacteroidota bacterium]
MIGILKRAKVPKLFVEIPTMKEKIKTKKTEKIRNGCENILENKNIILNLYRSKRIKINIKEFSRAKTIIIKLFFVSQI